MINIKKIITAIENPIVNSKLKNININVITSDIQYKEGVIEFLEKNSKIDFIILKENLPGNLTLIELIKKIKQINSKIKIILFINKNGNKEEENEYVKRSVYEMINNLNVENIQGIIDKNNVFNKTEIPINDFFNESTKEGKILTIIGTNGIGKSTFSIMYAKSLVNKKVLIIDFDVLNNSLHTILGVKEYSKKIQTILKNNKNINFNDQYIDLKDFIIKTNINVDLISGINLILDSKYQISSTKLRNLISKIKNSYDEIIIDTSADYFLDYTKELIKIANQCIFISGANTLEVKKAITLLNIYEEEWKINREKFNILFNKYSSYSIDDKILKHIFSKYKIIGKIKLSDYYDLVINQNEFKINNIENEINKIRDELNKSKIKLQKSKKKIL